MLRQRAGRGRGAGRLHADDVGVRDDVPRPAGEEPGAGTDRPGRARHADVDRGRLQPREQRFALDWNGAKARVMVAKLARLQGDQETALALAEVRRELDGIRQAQAADADKLRKLFEAQRIPEAATYLASRMLGLKLDDSAQALLTLVQSAVAEDAPVTPEVSTLDGATAPAADAAVIPVVVELPPPVSTPSAGSTEPPPRRRSPARERPLTSQAPVFTAVGVDRYQPPSEPHLSPGKVGRNTPCPCGSGKKFKRCCGSLAE